jgi:hypothetical protein
VKVRRHTTDLLDRLQGRSALGLVPDEKQAAFDRAIQQELPFAAPWRTINIGHPCIALCWHGAEVSITCNPGLVRRLTLTVGEAAARHLPYHAPSPRRSASRS